MFKKRTSYLLISGALLAAGAPALVAQTSFATVESHRIVQPVNNNIRSTRANSHLNVLERSGVKSGNAVPDSQAMNHMQFVLQASDARKAALQALIAGQHDPSSAQFQKWVSPAEFGSTYGVTDADIATVTNWLVSQGFTVNGVSPNKLQIDFSGTAGLVRKAFQTKEMHYTINGVDHIANNSDITLPTALDGVVLGVAGLNNLHPHPLHVAPQQGSYNKSTHLFENVKGLHAAASGQSTDALAQLTRSTLAIQGNGTRALVPYDMQAIYDIKALHAKGLTGQGVTIAVVGEAGVGTAEWNQFEGLFGLTGYGGTLATIVPSGTTACTNPGTGPSAGDTYYEAVLDAEWSASLAPGATIWSANCGPGSDTNFFGGVIDAAYNLVNNASATARPNIISMSYGYGEDAVDAASKEAFDSLWAQADAEGISVFVASGDSSTNPDFNGTTIHGTGLSVNAAASGPNDTVVGGTDTADILAGTTSKYFGTPNAVYGSALSYVPEITWNESCGNTYADQEVFKETPVKVCQQSALFNSVALSEGGSGGASALVAKPSWQRVVKSANTGQTRGLPDVSLFGGAFGNLSLVVICTSDFPCAAGFPSGSAGLLTAGTSLSSPMFAGIQAVIDQGLKKAGAFSVNQGNAAPTLYELASAEYGGATGRAPASLAQCSSLNGTKGTASCVFHNITAGGNSANCVNFTIDGLNETTPNCFYYGEGLALYDDIFGLISIRATLGLTTTDTNPVSYTSANTAYPATAGWNFANGLGSVDAVNLLAAWRKFDGLE